MGKNLVEMLTNSGNKIFVILGTQLIYINARVALFYKVFWDTHPKTGVALFHKAVLDTHPKARVALFHKAVLDTHPKARVALFHKANLRHSPQKPA